MTKKLIFTDRGKAAYMAQEFGVKFKANYYVMKEDFDSKEYCDKDFMKRFKKEVRTESDPFMLLHSQKRLEVAEESLHIFKPKHNDYFAIHGKQGVRYRDGKVFFEGIEK